ncbi:MAG TPA: metallophosphoesterase [Blastocatellia bacterium]|nr:metallophosphoesterase [Blastocatellia bacterium]
MIRVAAIGDVHFSDSPDLKLGEYWAELHEHADLFLLAGDLTTHGGAGQARALASQLSRVRVPIFAVLGNHDYHEDQTDLIRKILADTGVTILEGRSAIIVVNQETIGIAGTSGFGGGFAGACGSAFGEPEMKAFIHHTELLATRLEKSLGELQSDFRVALLHYSPVKDTIAGERLEIYPFLGSYLLAEAIDRGGADLVIHGHAHHGQEKGVTARGIPVRNVAFPMLRRPYAVYDLERVRSLSADLSSHSSLVPA